MTLKHRFTNRGPLHFPELSENPWFTVRPKRSVKGAQRLTVLELCPGAGGQALGYEQTGIDHAGLVELDKDACATLRLNCPSWNVIEEDLNTFDGAAFKGVDIVAGGLPCAPSQWLESNSGQATSAIFSPRMILLVDQIRACAVMIEYVRGILDGVFLDYRLYLATFPLKIPHRSSLFS